MEYCGALNTRSTPLHAFEQFCREYKHYDENFHLTCLIPTVLGDTET